MCNEKSLKNSRNIKTQVLFRINCFIVCSMPSNIRARQKIIPPLACLMARLLRYIHPHVSRYARVDMPCRQTIIRRNRLELFLSVTLMTTSSGRKILTSTLRLSRKAKKRFRSYLRGRNLCGILAKKRRSRRFDSIARLAWLTSKLLIVCFFR